MSADLDNIEAALGHRLQQREILVRALTHSSYTCEHDPGSDNDYEQMEFLGDSILGFLVSEYVVRRFPSYQEGRLTILKARLVSAVHLFEVAKRLDVGQFILLGRGEEMDGGRGKRKLLVNCLEALIAAMYLDGGIDVTRQFVNHWVLGEAACDVLMPEEGVRVPLDTNHKGLLSELTQARNLPPPRYIIVKEQGPEHAKMFTVEVRVGREWTAQAEGLSKKIAAQCAARDLLARLMEPSQ